MWLFCGALPWVWTLYEPILGYQMTQVSQKLWKAWAIAFVCMLLMGGCREIKPVSATVKTVLFFFYDNFAWITTCTDILILVCTFPGTVILVLAFLLMHTLTLALYHAVRAPIHFSMAIPRNWLPAVWRDPIVQIGHWIARINPNTRPSKLDHWSDQARTTSGDMICLFWDVTMNLFLLSFLLLLQEGMTALHWASEVGHINVVRMLQAAGAQQKGHGKK